MSIIQITTTTNSTMSSTTTTATCSDLSPMTKERTHSLSSTTSSTTSSSSSLFSSISALSSPSSTSSTSSPSSSPSSSSITSTTKECARMAALASKWANRKCAVCSAPAKSFNYNALTCQSCRLFFFRHAWQRNSLVCFGDQNCPMVGVARKCQKCRMDRCLAKGMEPRRVKFNRNKLAAAHHYNHNSHHSLSLHSTSSPFFLNSSSSSSEILHAEDILLNNSSNSNSPSSTSTSTSPSESSMEMHYLQALTAATRHIPNEAVLPSSRTEVDFEAVLNLPSLYLKYVGRYCREMYGFKELAEGQQARLFKAFFPQFIIARLASVLDPKLLTFRALADDTGIHVTVIQPASLGNLWYGSLLFETMSNLLPLTTLFDGDTVIRDLFTALLYFQAGQQVMPHFEVMRYHYHIYSNLLLSYLVSKYSGGSTVNPVERHRQLLAFNQVMEAAAITGKVRLGLIFNVSEQVFGYRFRLDEALEKIFDIALYQRHFPLNGNFAGGV